MKISRAESHVMEAVWRESPLSAEDIAIAVADRGWSEGTVKTLVSRLLAKGALAAHKEGRRYLYRPTVRREDYVRSESRSFLDRLFDGRLAPLVSHLSDVSELDAEDIAELKALVEKLK